MVDPKNSPPAKKSRKNREKPFVAGSSSETMMEQRIWKEFPEDLFEAVVARLPIAAFFRLRSVCRKWNSLLDSHSFSQHCSELPPSLPWLYGITHESVGTGAMYDPSSRRWHHLSIPALPAKIVIPATSAGGLLCFLDISHQKFYISNPLTRLFRELPPRSVQVWSRVAIGMTMDEDSTGGSGDGGYKIMWLGCNGDYEIYDSRQDSWTRPSVISADITLPLFLNFRSQAVSIGHTVYFMRAEPDGIVSYNTESRVWRQFSIPVPPHVMDHAIAECGGRILLVGLLTKNAATCVCVWELQRMTLLWKEVDRMPNIWCLEFYGKHVKMNCLGNRRLIMLSLRSRQMNRLVTYDVLSKEWRKVPGCVLQHGRRKKQWIACGTSFHPSLTASA
ncbi:unnamed protein product [Spirodela intermedia]|uniref:F-box domain-containing protein n=1 Tax=Spirodela intermedia TaxID=51605 RepID=A0A7I8KG70_SPIIN|nr:unnamed protein product [Spirodela intermedia]